MIFRIDYFLMIYILIRNEGEDQGMRGEELGVGQGQQGTSKTLGGPI
jgi:hypothetical protein